MSKYNTSSPNSSNKKSYKSNTSKKSGFSIKSRSGGFKRPNGRNMAVVSYDPQMLIKKVEEQQIAPQYISKHTFADFLIDKRIKENIAKKGYVSTTPIQDQAIPVLLQGKDVIATANTGTGKTAAFLIPLVHNVLTNKTRKVLIITPTRELAAQIQSELAFFKSGTGLNSSLCIGGLSLNTQMQHLKKNPEFIIGTPGRLIDLEENKSLHFNTFDAIVLDEVDRMLDMGFINDIKHIIKRLPQKRHSLFFSATIPGTLKSVMDRFLHNPISISVKTQQVAQNVNQDIIKTESRNKLELLHDLLIKPEFTRVIIFARTKRAVDRLATMLKERGFEVAAIHGDKTQAHRKKALEKFKEDNVKILLATDVVARGIDIDDVSHVINYDLPQTYEDYIHRIGRTGRASKVGQAITFVE